MSLAPLDNPLERLGVNPTGMNWRDVWDTNTQYYLNDVVVAPSNNASYILSGKTALLGGADPAFNPDWIELSATTTGVNNITAGLGISITNTPTNPQINNTGVVSLVQGAGMLITDTGVGQKTITNDGIRGLSGSAGLIVGAGNSPTLTNTGVLGLTQGAGIAVGGGQIPTVSNTGILGLTAGTGIAITAGQSPTINNTQVENILSVIPFATTPIIPSPNPLGPITGVVDYVLNPNLSSAFYTQYAMTTPPAGVWVLDLTGFTFWIDPNIINAPASISIELGSAFFGIQYAVPPSQGGQLNLASNASGFPQPTSICAGKVIVNLGALKTTLGGQIFNFIRFTNLTAFNCYYTAYPSMIPCTYYPNGIQ